MSILLKVKPMKNDENWKSQVYIMGGIIGTIFGLLSAYLFARAAEEDAARNGGVPEKIGTMQIISTSLAGLTLIRQIAELGKPNKKK